MHHRSRNAGETKYGIVNRAWPAFFDCLAVSWLRRRQRETGYDEIERTLPRVTATPHREKAVT